LHPNLYCSVSPLVWTAACHAVSRRVRSPYWAPRYGRGHGGQADSKSAGGSSILSGRAECARFVVHDVARCPEDDGGCNPSRVGLIPARASTCPRGLTERHSASNRDDGSSILSVGADAFVAQGTSTGVRSQGKLSVEDGRNSGEVKLELGLAVK